jgi:hypothetical protein
LALAVFRGTRIVRLRASCGAVEASQPTRRRGPLPVARLGFINPL